LEIKFNLIGDGKTGTMLSQGENQNSLSQLGSDWYRVVTDTETELL